MAKSKSEYDRERYQKIKEEKKKASKEYYHNNKKEINLKNKVYYENNKELKYKQSRRWVLKNKEKVKGYKRKWNNNNKEYKRAHSAKRRAAKLRRTPAYTDLKKIKEFYMNCPKGYEVDHILPLQGKTVSGFHVLSNLQYLTISENRSKGNR